MTDCGEASECCCTSMEVTAGTYYRTYMNSGSGPTGEADPATVSGLRLDKYLVTVGRYRQFVNGGRGHIPAAGAGKHAYLNGGQGLANNGADGGFEPGWVTEDEYYVAPTNANLACSPTWNFATWTATASTQENLPINCVNWYEAYAFCIWDGGFLPSEAEWEFAAAGGSQQREYPWGSTNPAGEYVCYAADADIQEQYAIYGCDYPPNSTCTASCDSQVMAIAPVGTAVLGAGRWGQLDLAGEVWEWNLDWYAPLSACTDCTDATPGTARVMMGGDYSDPAPVLQYRYYFWPFGLSGGRRQAATGGSDGIGGVGTGVMGLLARRARAVLRCGDAGQGAVPSALGAGGAVDRRSGGAGREESARGRVRRARHAKELAVPGVRGALRVA
jgi:formylglycine-generating enzyme required for sulfatase activity